MKGSQAGDFTMGINKTFLSQIQGLNGNNDSVIPSSLPGTEALARQFHRRGAYAQVACCDWVNRA